MNLLQYHNDYENRLIEVQTGEDETVVEYTYNALGRRSQKHEVLGIDDDYYYLHDHLNSVVAVVDEDGEILERYEYDAYGKPTMWLGDYDMINGEISPYGNPYYFTGRRVDEIDNGAWLIQYNRNRFYDYDTGCWLNQDPIGYQDGVNLYAYVGSNPVNRIDPQGTSWYDYVPVIGTIATCLDALGITHAPGTEVADYAAAWTEEGEILEREDASGNRILRFDLNESTAESLDRQHICELKAKQLHLDYLTNFKPTAFRAGVEIIIFGGGGIIFKPLWGIGAIAIGADLSCTVAVATKMSFAYEKALLNCMPENYWY